MAAHRRKREEDDARPSSRGALLIAVAVSVVVGSFVPFGGTLVSAVCISLVCAGLYAAWRRERPGTKKLG
jgi:hypothetical protein